MKERNIGTSVHFIPLHIHPYYRELMVMKRKIFQSHYESISKSRFSSDLFRMSDEDVRNVVDAVVEIVEQIEDTREC